MSDGSGPPLLIGEKVWWLGSGSGLPKRGVVRWIGRLPEIGPDWALGIELEEGLPYGGVDGTWRGRQLFKCKPKHGLIVPSDRVLAQQSGGGSLDTARRNAALLLQKQVAAPPRLRRQQERSLLLDRHANFRSVHLEAVQIHRRLQQDQVVSLVLGKSSNSSGDVLSRGMTRTETAVSVVPRTRRTESLAARKEKSNSGLFSFLKWFRRENKTERGEERSSFSNPGSPVLRRSDSAITGSVDTLFSTATATSFAYVRPESYRPFGEAAEPEKWIFPGPETSTYRNRIRRREELKRLNQNQSLREKYNLYASGSLGRSLDEIFHDSSIEFLERLQPNESCSSTLSRKKRRAPAPPVRNDSLTSTGCDSLPTTLSKESLDDFKLHRRTVSESAKYKKKPYHVKGKRKAPPPPTSDSQERDSVYLDYNNTNTFRKKRKAPPPPIDCRKADAVNIPKEESLDIIENEKLRVKTNSGQSLPSTSRIIDQEVESISSTDTLRLEKGILKPNKMDKEFVEPKHAPTSPVSPRPWYKRPQSSGFSPKHNDSKKKEGKSIEDWMLESGFPRRSQGLPNDAKFSLFGRTDRPEDKRRSQISILTNISELDREAAEIIQRGKEREKSLLASYNAKYYVDSGDDETSNSSKKIDEGSQTDAVPKKATAKELITLFNSITNVSRVALASFVSHENTPATNNGSTAQENSNIQELKIKQEADATRKTGDTVNGFGQRVHQIKINVEPTPGPSKIREKELGKGKHYTPSSKSSEEESRISRVTIEELDEYDTEKDKSQEGKKIDRTPTNPVITEVSETSMKSSSGSTICSSLLNDSSSSISSESSTGAKIRSSQLFSHSPLQKKLSVWTCSRCTLENLRWRLTCEACDMWRPTVCDYKLCKKPGLADEQTDLTPSNQPEQATSNLKNEKAVRALDKETSNLIRNGQILTNLSARRLSLEKKNQNILKSISPIVEKKEMTTGIISSKNESDGTKVITDKSKSSCAPGMSVSNTSENEQSEVVRKARLAFFNKAESQDASSNTDAESANNMDNISKATTTDKLKLRELLKEMKNSLPKQRKTLNSVSSTNQPERTQESNSSNVVYSQVLKKQNSLGEHRVERVEKKHTLSFDEGRENVGLKSTEKYDNTNTDSVNDDNNLTNAHIKVNNDSKQTSFLNKPIIITDSKKAVIDRPTSGNNNISNITNKLAHTKPVIVDTVTKPGISDIKSALSNGRENTDLNEEKSQVIKTESIAIPVEVTTNTIIENDQANANKRDLLKPVNEKKSEAILIKSEIIIEEIKVKKKPEKVSSSAQTSTKVLSVDDNSSNSPKNDEVIVPVTAEEFILKENGSLASSSVRVEPVKIDVKKFELMRPRDFTSKSSMESASSKKTNCFEQIQPSPSTSSSGSSLQELNFNPVQPEPTPEPSTSKGESSQPMGTIALNRLLKKLESAISGGQHDAAAVLAKELARLKIPCSVVRHSPTSTSAPDILMNVIIEDRTTQRGPISVQVKPTIKLGDLKKKMEKEHNVPAHLQRWFIDKKLANDDEIEIKQLGIDGPTRPVFLYLIAPEVAEKEAKSNESKIKLSNSTSSPSQTQNNELPQKDDPHPSTSYSDNLSGTLPSTQSLGWRCTVCSIVNRLEDKACIACNTVKSRLISSGQNQVKIQRDQAASVNVNQKIKDPPREEPKPSTSSLIVERERQENYKKLVALEKDELVVSIVSFECPVCFVECKPPEGIVLKECLHSFCRACLSKTVEYSEEAEVKCPFRDDTYTCNSTLLEREIKALVTPEAYEEHLAKSIALAETKISNAFHCKTPDCKGWCIYEDNVNLFKCPVCLLSNCLTCQAIHEGLDCKQYQEQLNQDSEVNIEAKRTKDMLQEMVDRGEAMPCPRCKVVLMKKWGCDWLRCSMCKTEICWVTRGARWGPNGKGDTSGGCQCGVNGVKCHPKCNYCH